MLVRRNKQAINSIQPTSTLAVIVFDDDELCADNDGCILREQIGPCASTFLTHDISRTSVPLEALFNIKRTSTLPTSSFFFLAARYHNVAAATANGDASEYASSW
jgi:hypothetical protein